jgi:hypothetical protein
VYYLPNLFTNKKWILLKLQAMGHFTSFWGYELCCLFKTLLLLKCRTAIKVLFFNIYLSLCVMLDSLSSSLSSMSFLTNCYANSWIELIFVSNLDWRWYSLFYKAYSGSDIKVAISSFSNTSYIRWLFQSIFYCLFLWPLLNGDREFSVTFVCFHLSFSSVFPSIFLSVLYRFLYSISSFPYPSVWNLYIILLSQYTSQDWFWSLCLVWFQNNDLWLTEQWQNCGFHALAFVFLWPNVLKYLQNV